MADANEGLKAMQAVADNFFAKALKPYALSSHLTAPPKAGTSLPPNGPKTKPATTYAQLEEYSTRSHPRNRRSPVDDDPMTTTHSTTQHHFDALVMTAALITTPRDGGQVIALSDSRHTKLGLLTSPHLAGGPHPSPKEPPVSGMKQLTA